MAFFLIFHSLFQLRSLALADSAFLLMALLGLGLPKLWPWYSLHVFSNYINILFGLLHTSRVACVCITVSVNLERVCAVCFPLRACHWKKHLLPVSVFVAVVYNIPK